MELWRSCVGRSLSRTRSRIGRAAHYRHATGLAEGPYAIPGTGAAASVLANLARGWRAAGLPPVHIVRLYRDDGSNVDACRRSLIESGVRLVCPSSQGSQLVSGISPEGADDLDFELLLRGVTQRLGPHEAVVYKPRWSAFFGTPLEDHLRAAGVSTLVVTGCNYPNCPRATICDASCRDYRLIVVRDGISGLQAATCPSSRAGRPGRGL